MFLAKLFTAIFFIPIRLLTDSIDSAYVPLNEKLHTRDLEQIDEAE
jgi:hypothetical protein